MSGREAIKVRWQLYGDGCYWAGERERRNSACEDAVSCLYIVKEHFAISECLTAQQYFGHADPATTLRIYTHLTDETQMKDADKVRRAFL
jgi:integrase